MIYCVEDDAGIRELVVYTLQNTGLEARGFADGEALFAALREQKPDPLLLDIMLPGQDGHLHPAPPAGGAGNRKASRNPAYGEKYRIR